MEKATWTVSLLSFSNKVTHHCFSYLYEHECPTLTFQRNDVFLSIVKCVYTQELFLIRKALFLIRNVGILQENIKIKVSAGGAYFCLGQSDL